MESSILVLPGVLTPSDLAVVLAGLAEAAVSPSLVSGGAAALAADVRRSTRLTPPAGIDALLRSRLEALAPTLAEHFGRPLGALEPLQVLRYGPGDHFVAHQDGNTPLTWDETRHRRVSVSLLLSEPGGWRGGELVFHGPGGERRAASATAGGAIAFPSEATHEVTPLTAGERLSVAGWFRAP